MNCTDFLAKLTDYFDGTIAGELLSDVKKHLGECHHCEVVVNTTRKTIDVYKDNEVYAMPDELCDRMRSAIMKRCCETGRKVDDVKKELLSDAKHVPPVG